VIRKADAPITVESRIWIRRSVSRCPAPMISSFQAKTQTQSRDYEGR
jgi:hypothetical protein